MQTRRGPEIAYDPYSYAIQDDPYSVFRQLRESAPVYYNHARGIWVLSRFEDVRAALRDHEAFSSEPGVDLETDLHELFEGSFLQRDPPRHKELRDVVRSAFAPSRVASLEPAIRRRARALVDAVAANGGGDLYREFALPLPVAIISQILGIPDGDGAKAKRWTDLLDFRNPDDDTVTPEGVDAGSALRAYFEALAEARRARPKDDLVSAIVAADAGGEALSVLCAAGMCMLLFAGGNQTTASLLTNALLTLHEHPEERRRLAAEPAGIPAAIEELLRYESPVQLFARTVTRDVAIHGVRIPAGSRVVVLYGAANRDERVFEHADRLDLTRPPSRHLAFGHGIHFCLGAPLARLEARIALEELLARIPDYRIVGPVERFHTAHERRIVRLPVEV